MRERRDDHARLPPQLRRERDACARLAPTDEDWVVVNSCAVTNEAVRQTRQAIRRSRRERPDARILVTGCAAELEPESPSQPCPKSIASSEMPTRFGSLRRRIASRRRRAGFLGHVRSFVAIQNGCDHRCTFCSIWQARGPSRSLPFEAIRDAVERELDRGAKEIVLTGVDITSYDCDGWASGSCASACSPPCPASSACACRRSTASRSTTPLFELIAGEPRLMPHFHLSLQAGDDMILKRMKRRHSRADAVAHGRADQGRATGRHDRRRPDRRLSHRN